MAVKPKPLSALRHASRRVAGMISHALLPLLLVQGGVLWFLYDGAEIRLPDATRDLLKGALAETGLACTWREARLSLSGRIELTDAKVGAAGAGDPVFEAGRLVTVLDVFDLVFSKKITPRRLWLDRGRLICPSVLSPTGKTEVALDAVRASLVREGDRLVVQTLQARCAGVPLVAHGRILPPAQKKSAAKGAETRATDHPLRAPGTAAARLVALRPWLERLDDASLDLSGEDTPAGVKLELTGLAGSLRLPEVELDRVRLKFGAVWDAAGIRPGGVAVFSVGSLRASRAADGAVPAFDASCGNVVIRTAFGAGWETPKAASLTATRPHIRIRPKDTESAPRLDCPLDRADLVADWSEYPRLRFETRAIWRRENLRASVILNGDTGETDIACLARLRLAELAGHPAFPKDLPAELASLSIAGDADVSAHARLGKHYAFERAEVVADTGHTRLGEIEVQSLRADVEVLPDAVNLRDLVAIGADQRVWAHFESGLAATSRYRLLLRGSAYPGQVTPFVGKWWSRIWKDLTVSPGFPPSADIEVEGLWDGQPYEFIFGSVGARRLGYQGQVFDRATLNILEQPHRLCLYDLNAKNPDGTWATGRLEWVHRMPDHARDSVRFLFKGRLPLLTAAKLGGEDVVSALADISLRDPAEATIVGRYHGPGSPTPEREQLQVDVDAKGPFEAWRIPGEDFSGRVLVDTGRIQVKDAKLRYAGGATSAEAWLLRTDAGYRLTFDTTFDQCDRTAFFDGLARLKAPSPDAPKEPSSDAPKEPTPAADLSGTLRARMTLPDIATLDGKGHGVTTDPGLFKLPLLGALSRGMESMGIDAATYRFVSADSDFVIRKGTVWFPSLTVRGPEAEVQARGTYEIGSGNLLFRAVLNPKSEGEIPLLSWAKAMVNRGTRIFPVDIRGTLTKPEWSVDVSPGVIFAKPKDDGLGIPPPPAKDDGRW